MRINLIMQIMNKTIQKNSSTERSRNIPQLRFPEFEGEWEKEKFKDLVKINQGLQIQISERYTEKVDNSYFYITNEFLKANSKNKYYIKNPSKSVLCNKDDILMTRTGNTGMVVTNVEGAFHNNFFKIAYPDFISKHFLYYFLNLSSTQNNIKKLAGTSTIPDLNHSDFYRIELPFPTLPEQQKIANFLTAVDSKLQALKKKKELLAQYKKGVMQKLFSVKADGRPSLRFKTSEGNNFADWEVKTLGEVLTIGSGRDYKHLEEGNIPVYGTGGYMTSVNQYLFDGESVCIGRKGTIDKPKYYNEKFWTVDTLFYTHKFIDVIPKFIFYTFLRINWKLYNEASGVPSLSKRTIEAIKINVPSLEEQTKIANFLSAIDDKITNCELLITKAEQYKKGLLQQMFV